MECQQRCVAQRKVHDRRLAEIPSRTHREYGLITRDRRNVCGDLESQFRDAPACFALRTRASFEDRHPAKTKATLRPKTIRDVRLGVG